MILFQSETFLQHSSDEFVDVLLSVSVVTADDVVVSLLVEATERRAELERPEEVVDLLEVRTDGVDLVDQVLHARDAVLTEGFLDLAVAAETDALTVDATEATLVAQHTDGLQVRVAPSDVGLDLLEHVEGSLVDADEGTVVDLSQAEELENLTALRGDTEDALKRIKEKQSTRMFKEAYTKTRITKEQERNYKIDKRITYLLILMTKASLGSASLKKLPAMRATRRLATRDLSTAAYSFSYF